MTWIMWAVGALFAIGAALALYRVVVGPSILDRMIASDVLLTALILVVCTEMVLNNHTRSIPLTVVLAATAVFGTIAVARYVSRQDSRTGSTDRAAAADVALHRYEVQESLTDAISLGQTDEAAAEEEQR